MFEFQFYISFWFWFYVFNFMFILYFHFFLFLKFIKLHIADFRILYLNTRKTVVKGTMWFVCLRLRYY